MTFDNTLNDIIDFHDKFRVFQSEETKEGVISGPLVQVANVVGMFKIIPELEPFATPIELSMRMGAAILNWFGWSQPSIKDKELFYNNQTVQDFSTLDGRKPLQPLSNSHTTQVAITADACGFGANDDMEASSIITRWGMVAIGSIANTNVAGDNLLTLYSFPTACYTLSAVSNEITPLCSWASFFKQWSGPMQMMIKVIASPMHRATLMVSIDPDYLTATPTYATAVQTLPNTIIHVSGTTETIIDIPYQANAPFLYNKNWDLATNASISSSARINVFMVNPLQSSGSTSPVNFIVYYRGTNTTAFALPSLQVYGTSAPHLQSVSSSLPDSTYKRFFGEHITSLRQLAKKAIIGYHYNDTALADNASRLYQIPVGPSPGTKTSGTLQIHNTYVSLIESMFYARRGGLRVTFIPNLGIINSSGNRDLMPVLAFTNEGISAREFVATVPTYGVVKPGNNGIGEELNNIISSYYAIGYQQIHPTTDVQVPFYFPYYFMATGTLGGQFGTPNDTAIPGAVNFFMQPTESTQMNANFLIAGADDFSCFFYRGFPAV